MGENLIMSNQEIDRLKIIHSVINEHLTWPQAAAQLGLSERQVGRLVARIREQGNPGIIHGLRGQPSNYHLPPSLLPKALGILSSRYQGFGPTLANEKLKTHHRIYLSTYTLRQGMIEKGLWKPRKQKDKHRAWRERRACVGELIQLDGSDHPWFEDRGPRCVLLIFIDDATSRILYGEFVTVEDAVNLLKATRQYLKKWGRPLAFYVDKDSIYKVNRPSTIEEELGDVHPLTQFTRAMAELGIAMSFAHSPQAKGRVERGFKTHQDRLVKELRLKGISTIKAANRFLWEVYIPDHNARCAIEPTNPTNAHRPLLKSHNLDRILSIQSERVVANDYTLRFQNRFFQLLSDQPVRVRPKDKIIVEQRLGGLTHLRFKERYLTFKSIPKPAYRPLPPIPATKHPKPGTLAYSSQRLYVGAWAVKKDDVSTSATVSLRR